ncbi:MAG: biotin--[acetyl-CoA-carboxylase] ligase [Verrucomicrobiae bacterium]|nr:biotin--[acetyl-CoA-carboxylase] ligase [Verrucomicrobiae bacterium]
MDPDVTILRTLQEAGPTGYVSGEDLARSLKISRTAVWARIDELRKAGLHILAVPNLGYRLDSHDDVLIAAHLRSRLQTQRIGHKILVFRETASTQDLVGKLAREGAPEGLVVFAESQKKGRGRLGRAWSSPPGSGLWFSALLRPPWPPSAVTRLTAVFSVAIARAIEAETPVRAHIKYPNDILCGDRKLCGILTELHTEIDRVDYAVVGVGLNVNATVRDFPAPLRSLATSLRLESGEPLLRARLAVRILQELDALYAQSLAGGFPTIAEEWSRRCSTLHKKITVTRGGTHRISGTATGIDEDGSLLIRHDSGRIEAIHGGDLTVEKP